MVAIEVSVNGKIVYTIGAGERGMLTAEIAWACIDQLSGKTFEEYWVAGLGLAGNDKGALHWPRTKIKMGDVVTVRLIESDAIDEPSSVPIIDED